MRFCIYLLLVNESQAAFVSGRNIMTNVLVCQDMVRSYNRKSGSHRCLMKIDIRKAYDMVHWQFLFDVLEAMNFPAQFIKWIVVCLRTARFHILIDGLPCGYFPGKRGLRQGDLISPYLFVIVMEVLSRKLKDLDDVPEFKFHYKCQSLKLNHLDFADDFAKPIKHRLC